MFAFIHLTSILITLMAAWQVQTYSVTFNIKHGVGSKAEGTLKGLVATLVFDEAQPALTDITATILTSTINTGLGMRDSKIKGEDYLDVVHYPQIKLRIRGGTLVAQGQYRSDAVLTIKGKDQKIPLTFTFNKGVTTKNQTSGRFMTKFTISRLDFGVGTSSWILADSLTVNIVATALSN